MQVTASAIPEKADIDVSKLSPEGKELFSCITAFFERIMKDKDLKISRLEEEVSQLKEKTNELENELDENAAYMRRETLVMSGAPSVSAQNENCKSMVIELLKQHVKLKIDSTDISVAHRVGAKPNQGPDKRNIVFKLCRRELKYDILSACRQQRPPFYINESLTPTRAKILYALRQLKRKFPLRLRYLRTTDGTVYAFLAPTGSSTTGPHPISRLRRVTVNSRKQLDVFLEAKFNVTLDDLGVGWERK